MHFTLAGHLQYVELATCLTPEYLSVLLFPSTAKSQKTYYDVLLAAKDVFLP